MAAQRKKRETKVERAERATEIARRIERAVPMPRLELDFQSPWQLLVATILAAQALDATINKITPPLFAKYPTPRALADAAAADVEVMVRSSGYFRNKTKAIMAVSRALLERHGGEVPKTMDELCALPGVARKTANVVLGGAYRIAGGMAVDTHVGRVARRLRLTRAEDPDRVESALCALFPEASWIDTTQRFVLHGRYHCVAKKPRCTECALSELCASAEAAPVGSVAERAAIEAKRIADADVRARTT